MPYERLGDINGTLLGEAGVKTIGPVILRDTMTLEAGASIISANFADGTTGFKFHADGTGQMYGNFSVGGDISLDGGTIYTALDRSSDTYLAIGDPHGTGLYEEISWWVGATQRAFISQAANVMTIESATGQTLGTTDTVFELAAGSVWGKGYADLYVGLYNKSSVAFWKNNDGTETTPSYTFGSDTNTGIYRSAADTLRITTGGSVIAQFASGVTLYGALSTRSTSPVTDNTYNLGTSTTYRWANVYMVGGSGAAATDININTTTGQLFQVTSSRRYKKNIKPYRDGLDMLLALRPVNFQWKKGKSDAGYDDSFLDLGLIAEEVAEVAPEFVVFNEDDQPESVRYSSLVMPLINAVRELADEVDRLSAMIG